MRLIFDIETDDLKATRIWCIVARDIDTNEEYVFGPDALDEGVELLAQADYLSGHNIIGFDIPVVEQLTGKNISHGTKVVDTLVLSRLFNPSREGRHSLDSWGSRLGLSKIDFCEYEKFSPEMLEYCRRDVELNLKVYNALKEEAKGFSKESIELEHEVMWLISRQRDRGFLLDEQKASILSAELREKMADAESKVREVFKPKVTSVKLEPKFTKTGNLSKMASVTGQSKGVRLTEEEHEELSDKKYICRYAVEEFNLGSRPQIGEYLQEFGWKPKEFTETGRAKVDESILVKIRDIPEAKLISDYLLLQKRVAQVDSWLEFKEEDGRVHGYVDPNGAITGRMTHAYPNLAAVPNVHSLYGEECRGCWIVPEGYKLVGIDASQLELRVLAHFMNDKDYIEEIINGDIHSENQRIAGLEQRDQAKTFIFALIYGAGDTKLGSVVGGNTKDGKRLRERFFHNLPSFQDLRNRVSQASSRGFLKGLDKRKIFVRSEHAALNTLLQSAGAVAMKKALVIFGEQLKELDRDVHFVCNIHDEWQVEAPSDIADTVGQLGVDAIRKAGAAFDLHCPLDGEYKVGNNWSETH